MAENKLIIPIPLPNRDIELHLVGETSKDIILEKSDAVENGEAPFQIIEGCSYEYKIENGFSLQPSQVISQSKVNESSGRISPNIYVGTLNIDILNSNGGKCSEIKLEVQSVKATYREDYRFMLEEITEKCTDLLLQHSSPVSQFFEVDVISDSNTMYQRFAFIKSILDSVEFSDAVFKITSAPVTGWKERETIKDIRAVKRFNNSTIRQLTAASNRINLPDGHPLKSRLKSISSKINVNNKTETVDTPENRFVKHALTTFQSFCTDFYTKLGEYNRIKNEASLLVDKLEKLLSQSVFKDISALNTIPLNSPVLQRKEGYREVLKVWLTFDLAAKMVWHGGEDVYSGNKRDVAVLYEYWLFFKLLDILKDVFNIDSIATEHLIEPTADGLGLKLKQGKFLPIEGVYITDTRKLRVEFSYNKAFSGEKRYPNGGSWTRNLRPDYTLSIWPFGIEQEQAENEELIVHIHFDAKYKVENIKSIFGQNDFLEKEKEEQKSGIYKRADLLKMHTYRDAIRRTAGAYVLYPGSVSEIKHGFHEVIPGLGAFAIRPTRANSGSEELKKFLNDVVAHLLNRASQREKISLKTYETYKDDSTQRLVESLPETYGSNRSLIPDETYVLVAYYREENWEWIIDKGLYNARAESARGSLRLGPKEAGARYLLLHSEGETVTSKILRITESGPRIYSKQTLIEKAYPTIPSHNYYLVYKVETVQEKELLNKNWDIKGLVGYKLGRGSALPFAASMTELMTCIKK